MDKYIINNHVEGDPLDEKNLDKVLKLVHEIRLSSPDKTIWLYTGFTWGAIWDYSHEITSKQMGITNEKWCQELSALLEQRREIIRNCNVLVDGRYIDLQKNLSLKFCGSENQRLIDIQKSLQKGDVVLWENK